MEDFRRLAGESARHHATDLSDMADRYCVSKQYAIHEYRLDEAVLRSMHAAAVRIVGDDDIAFLDALMWDFLRCCLEHQRHAADLRRIEFGDTDHLAPGVAEAAGEIHALVEDRRIGGLHHRQAHLAANRNQRGIDDVHGDHVHREFRFAQRKGGSSKLRSLREFSAWWPTPSRMMSTASRQMRRCWLTRSA